MNKSKWDTSDWWDWLFSHSDDAVVAELKSQAVLLREALEVVELAADLCHGNVVEDVLVLTPKAQALIPKIKAALEAK